MSVWNWFTGLFRRWQSWVSGGSLGGTVVVVLWVLDNFTRVKVPYSVRLFTFFVLFIVASSYVTWRDCQIELHELRKQFADATSGFTLKITSVLFGVNQTKPCVIVWISIANSGTPSAAIDMSLEILTADGLPVTISSIRPPIPDLTSGGRNGEPFLKMDRNDYLPMKALSPIQTGAVTLGFVVFDLSVPLDLLNRPGTTYSFRCADVHGAMYSTSFKPTEENLQTFGPAR